MTIEQNEETKQNKSEQLKQNIKPKILNKPAINNKPSFGKTFNKYSSNKIPKIRKSLSGAK